MTTAEALPNLRGRRCAVLGAGGFIGTNLLRALAALGADLIAFGHRSRFPEVTADVPWVLGTFGDQALLREALRGREIVFHLLGGTGPASSDPRAELLSETTNTLNLLDRCREEGVGRIVLASSGGTVYGAADAIPTAESQLPAPISAYGLGKLITEGILALHARLYGLRQVTLRIANPYGPYQTAVRSQGIVAAALSRGLRGEPLEVWGTGEVVRDFVYIDDVCDAFVRAADYVGEHQVFNIGSGIGRSINSVLEDVDRLIRPTRLLVTHRPGRPADVPVSVLSIERSRRELGWEPRTTWGEGLSRMLAWAIAAERIERGNG